MNDLQPLFSTDAENNGRFYTLQADPANPQRFYATADQQAWAYRITEIEVIEEVQLREASSIVSIAFHPEDTLFAVALSADGSLALWDTNGETLARMTNNGSRVMAMQFNPDGSRLLVARREDPALEIWGMENGEALTAENAYQIDLLQTVSVLDGEPLWSAYFSDNGDTFIGTKVWDDSDVGDAVEVWDVMTGIKQSGFQIDTPLIRDQTAEGNLVLRHDTTDDNDVITIFNPSWERVMRFASPNSQIYGAAMNIDGSLIALGLRNGDVELHDTATGELLHRIPDTMIEGAPNYIIDITFSVDGRLLTYIDSYGHLSVYAVNVQPLPLIQPTPAPTSTTEPLELRVNGMAAVTSETGDMLNLRSDAGRNFDLVTSLEAGTIVTLLGGPVEADGLVWWQIRTETGVEGWAVESVEGDTTLTPIERSE